MTINERIRQVRETQNLTVSRFAEIIGLTKGAVSLIENGRSNPATKTITAICDAFDVSETWLRTGDGEMKAYAEKNDRLAALVARLGRPKAEATLRIVDTVLSAVDDETARRIWDAFLLEAQRMIRENEEENGGD